MLKSIFIKDFTLIDELSIDFDSRLNILTGETGAGKSIIIDAIDSALGARASKDLVKTGKQKALIELNLEVQNTQIKNFLDEQGIELESDKTIVISREITSNTSRSRVNGIMVTQNTLQELKNLLIDIHSQHLTYKYLQPKTHIDLLDAYGDIAHKKLLTNYKEKYNDLLKTQKELKQAIEENTDTEQRIEFLNFQIAEIQNAQIGDIDEYENLKAEREKIINAQELKELSYTSYYSLYGQEGSILDILNSIENKLIKASETDRDLETIANNIAESSVILKDISDRLRDYTDCLCFDPQRLEEIEDRLNLLEKIRRKYGATIEGVLTKLTLFQNELKTLETIEERVKALEKSLSTLQENTEEIAKELSNSRKVVAKTLSELVKNELKKLALPNSKFELGFKPKPIDSKGIDEVEFIISTNPGENLKSLAKIASGGEISRVMLAIKTIFAKADNVNTVIFDEIDTGISGPTLQSVADKMTELSLSHQIICITHNPIIAAAATKHFHVEKQQKQNFTKVEIKPLNNQERLETLSKIAAGEINESSLAFAKKLLNKKQ